MVQLSRDFPENWRPWYSLPWDLSMKTLEELVKGNAPRLVVLFKRQENGTDQFQWGMSGKMPLLTLIGSVAKAQIGLSDNPVFINGCIEQAFVIAFDPDSTQVLYFCNEDIPTIPLIGMLESIKTALTNSRVGQGIANQQTQILGPDGNPMKV